MAALSDIQIQNTVKWVFLCEFFSILSPGIGRIAYAFLLLGLVPPVQWRTRFLWSIIAIQFVVDIVTIIISFAQCRPLSTFWNHDVSGTCWSPSVQQDTGFFQGSVCSAVDLTLAVFPASMFWNLNMERKKKIFLSCLMGLGVFAMTASIIKTIELRAITAAADLTYAMAQLAIWWTLEANLVLIATSIPTLGPIIRRQHRHPSPVPDGSSRSSKGGGAQATRPWHALFYAKRSKTERGSSEDLWPGVPKAYALEESVSREQKRGIKKTTTIGVGYEDVDAAPLGTIY
ncbi:integral membrane protein [Talaromyces stipitatus ATCC 10500]|nr:uncharacterized protein TSTA_052950 [Talaromyces stipitatus ATCC 10500]EED12777.1 integral membrane protein [Talaromyces stipitatus ATCC 10500]